MGGTSGFNQEFEEGQTFMCHLFLLTQYSNLHCRASFVEKSLALGKWANVCVEPCHCIGRDRFVLAACLNDMESSNRGLSHSGRTKGSYMLKCTGLGISDRPPLPHFNFSCAFTHAPLLFIKFCVCYSFQSPTFLLFWVGG